jgi:hypothetical protein
VNRRVRAATRGYESAAAVAAVVSAMVATYRPGPARSRR